MVGARRHVGAGAVGRQGVEVDALPVGGQAAQQRLGRRPVRLGLAGLGDVEAPAQAGGVGVAVLPEGDVHERGVRGRRVGQLAGTDEQLAVGQLLPVGDGQRDVQVRHGLAAVEGDAVEVAPLRAILGELVGRLLHHRGDELGLGAARLGRVRGPGGTRRTGRVRDGAARREQHAAVVHEVEAALLARGGQAALPAGGEVHGPQVVAVAVVLHVDRDDRIHEPLRVGRHTHAVDVAPVRKAIDAQGVHGGVPPLSRGFRTAIGYTGAGRAQAGRKRRPSGNERPLRAGSLFFASKTPGGLPPTRRPVDPMLFTIELFGQAGAIFLTRQRDPWPGYRISPFSVDPAPIAAGL